MLERKCKLIMVILAALLVASVITIIVMKSKQKNFSAAAKTIETEDQESEKSVTIAKD